MLKNTSNRRHCEINNIVTNLNNVKGKKHYSTKLCKKILQVALYTSSHFKGRTKNINYASLTSKEYFKFLYKEEFNQSNKKQKQKLKKIESHLQMLSINYESMYGKNNLFVEDKGLYTYKGKYDQSWNKISYYFHHTYNCNINVEEELENNIQDKIQLAVLILCLKSENSNHNLIFTNLQIKNILGISKIQFDKICKEHGFEYFIKYTPLAKEEKRLYETSSNQNIIRGCYFNNNSVIKALKIIDEYKVNVHYKNLYKLRLFFYRNNQKIEKDFFKDELIKETLVCDSKILNKYNHLKTYCDEPLWHKTTFFDFCRLQNVKNQINNYYQDSFLNNNKNTEKSFHMQKILSCGIHTKKKLDRLNNNIPNTEPVRLCKDEKVIKHVSMDNEEKFKCNEPKDVETLYTIARSIESDYIKMEYNLPIYDYSDFCDYTRKYFLHLKSHYKTMNVWKRICRFYRNSNIDEYIKKEFEKIQYNLDIYRSPIFSEKAYENCKSSDQIVDGLYWVEETKLAKIIQKEKNFYEQQDLTPIIVSIFRKYEDFEGDFIYTYDEFSSMVEEELYSKIDKNLSQQNWDHFTDWKDSVYYKKYQKSYSKRIDEELSKYGQLDIICFLLSKEKFNTLDELKKYLKRTISGCYKLNDLCSNVLSIINCKNLNVNLMVEKEYNLSLELLKFLKISNIDFDIINHNKSLIEYKAYNNDHRNDDISLLFEKEIKSLGLHPCQGGLNSLVYKAYLFKLKLCLMTIEEIKEELLTF